MRYVFSHTMHIMCAIVLTAYETVISFSVSLPHGMIDSVDNMKMEPSSPTDRDRYPFSRSSSTGSLHTLSSSAPNSGEGQGGVATGNMSSSSGHGNSSVIKLVAWCTFMVHLYRVLFRLSPDIFPFLR